MKSKAVSSPKGISKAKKAKTIYKSSRPVAKPKPRPAPKKKEATGLYALYTPSKKGYLECESKTLDLFTVVVVPTYRAAEKLLERALKIKGFPKDLEIVQLQSRYDRKP